MTLKKHPIVKEQERALREVVVEDQQYRDMDTIHFLATSSPNFPSYAIGCKLTSLQKRFSWTQLTRYWQEINHIV